MNPSTTARLAATLLAAVFGWLPMHAIGAIPPVPRIEIKPEQAFIDEKVAFALRDFPANQIVTVRVSSTNSLGQNWTSHAEFLTDRRGRVDVTKQAPVSGTYRRADASGLFWSMALPPGELLAQGPSRNVHQPYVFHLEADVNGHPVATATLQRLFIAPGVERIPVHDGRLRGTFFVPRGKAPHPGIIVLGGSEGGLSEVNAAFLASKGFAALALAYFDHEDLPKSLENIPLEYFEAAINWLQSRPEVRQNQIAVLGASRGGELALLLGATFRQVQAVVALAPSGVIWGAAGDEPAQPAWTHQGRPLPYVSFRDTTTGQQLQMQAQLLLQTTISSTPFFQMMLENRAAVEKATIPVEKINGPVLLVSGDDDQLWPSTKFSEMVMARLKQAKHPYPDHHLAYAGAGHLIPFPNLPATVNKLTHPGTTTAFALGGDPQHTAAAAADAWPRIVAFLHAAFSP